MIAADRLGELEHLYVRSVALGASQSASAERERELSPVRLIGLSVNRFADLGVFANTLQGLIVAGSYSRPDEYHLELARAMALDAAAAHRFAHRALEVLVAGEQLDLHVAAAIDQCEAMIRTAHQPVGGSVPTPFGAVRTGVVDLTRALNALDTAAPAEPHLTAAIAKLYALSLLSAGLAGLL